MKKKEQGKSYAKAVFWVLLLLTLYLLLGQKFKLMLIVGALIAIAGMSTFYYNYFHGPVNFELIKLATVLTSIAFGPVTGIITGVSSTFLSRLWSGRLDHRLLISLAGITLVAAAASIYSGKDIRILGIMLSSLYHLVTLPISIHSGDNPGFAATYALTNIGFNTVIFFTVAPFLLDGIMLLNSL